MDCKQCGGELWLRRRLETTIPISKWVKRWECLGCGVRIDQRDYDLVHKRSKATHTSPEDG